MYKLLVKHGECMSAFAPGGTFWGCCASQPRPRCLWFWWRTSCRRRCGSEHHYGPEPHWRGARCGSKSSANTHGKEILVSTHNKCPQRWMRQGDTFQHSILFCTGRKSHTHLHTEVRFLHLHHTNEPSSRTNVYSKWLIDLKSINPLPFPPNLALLHMLL